MLHSAIFLETYLATLTKESREIHCKCRSYTLLSGAATCSGFEAVHAVLMLCAIIAFPKKLRDKLQRGHVTRCNLPAPFLATPLQYKLQRNLYRVTLAVELGSSFCDDFRDFLKPLQVQPEIAMCNMSRATYNGFLFSTLRDKLQGNLHHITLA